MLRLLGAGALCVLLATTTACGASPSRSELTKRLQLVNGLTKSQANCVADGLFDRIDSDQLAAAAKPDNAGKVTPETITVIREVTASCVPVETTASP